MVEVQIKHTTNNWYPMMEGEFTDEIKRHLGKNWMNKDADMLIAVVAQLHQSFRMIQPVRVIDNKKCYVVKPVIAGQSVVAMPYTFNFYTLPNKIPDDSVMINGQLFVCCHSSIELDNVFEFFSNIKPGTSFKRIGSNAYRIE